MIPLLPGLEWCALNLYQECIYTRFSYPTDTWIWGKFDINLSTIYDDNAELSPVSHSRLETYLFRRCFL